MLKYCNFVSHFCYLQPARESGLWCLKKGRKTFSPFFIALYKSLAIFAMLYILRQATESPTNAVGIFYVMVEYINNSSVPCGTLMRPLPVLGVEQWGAELFSSPVINKYNVSFQSSTK